jgi:glucokinase
VSILEVFMTAANVNKVPSVACFAVAGPVKDNKVSFTNRDQWDIDGAYVGNSLGIARVMLINDFTAVGYGLLTLDVHNECVVLQEGIPSANGPIACLGPGTGLGQCFLCPINDSGDYACFPSEGGHTEFSPINEKEFDMLQYLKQKFSERHRISVERIVSGSGLANIYEFLWDKYPDEIDENVHNDILNAGDLKGAKIAANQQNTLCKWTMEQFISSFGSEAGVAALKFLPTGGLFLAGGLTPKNIDLITDPNGGFMAAFHDKV